MSRLARVQHGAEHLDAPVHDPRELETSLDHLAGVNRWLGGRRIVIRHLAPLCAPDRPTYLLDVGTGSADVPRAIVRWAREHGRPVRVVATDVHPQIVEIARHRTAADPEITVKRADARRLPFCDGAFDVAILSLTLHHFDDVDQLCVLRELRRVARRAVLVNELERNWSNYLGARLLAATLWRRDRITRHDGPLSVLRAFTSDELLDRARRAGLPNAHVRRGFFNRLLLVADLAAPTNAHGPGS
ncbi:MAG TPA: methyltransferase domain-containing protein [Longimicrobiales bacterium]|nr:methyltransferase domain-containing protein [Longimicrobiales bacterium]